ncbi:RhoGAP domain-containing protein [Heterostelium album PN500]|uniref:RhoGAP domain-containing protein n=1 Tax=Heterostelium pallidum (strain ATCC 26659 / Pp 5 / PN500) TaxID=670386 RepID=D3BMC2_HETP5|nr:RhoGAP domain-containing protein [Heterostelium album PN500]EFA77723.1 RhoGAP domain-containing protein [Heterostelium album PN500]|eukprot:XP_020429851.1 RhoGAP domain-containing protein [Heterostelium album PN500]
MESTNVNNTNNSNSNNSNSNSTTNQPQTLSNSSNSVSNNNNNNNNSVNNNNNNEASTASSTATVAADVGVSNASVKASLNGINHQHQKPLPPVVYKSVDVNGAWISNKLKEREPEFTKKENMVIFLGTWNVNGKKPAESLDQWLCPGAGVEGGGLSASAGAALSPDIYAIGFQELDLTAEALLLGDTTRALPWEQAIAASLATQGEYVKLLSRQLVGILLFVYVRKEHRPHITHVLSDIAAVGIMGMMGNKGGVAVRFQFYNTSICIINSHLNAHMENILRRNQDMKDIARTLKFAAEDGSTFLNIFDHDQLFWIGDLNYRIPLPDQEVRDKIIQKDFYSLFLADQLYLQMKSGAAFEGFQEPPISFAPTYKYDPGTNDYDSSEKKRTPAWCDRILWKTHKKAENVGILSYRRHELLSSDHRPVSASFIIKVRVVIPDAKSRIYQEIVKELDKKENDSMPDATINTNQVDFESVRFMVPVTRQLVLENVGQVIARFKFIPKLDERILCKPWLKIAPIAGMMIPKERVTIDLTVPSPSSPLAQQTSDAITVKKKADFIKHFLVSKDL